MVENQSERRNSGAQLLQEIEALSHSLYQSHTARRTASLSLPSQPIPGARDGETVAWKRSSISTVTSQSEVADVRSRNRRMSLSPWRSRPKAEAEDEDNQDKHRSRRPEALEELPAASGTAKKGIWNWKPIRALSHIGMQKLSVLFSVEVVAIQGVPASMNGLRLAVCVRKQETKEGSFQTMPARVLQGSADFEEMLFLRCHLYFSGAKHTPGVYRFEPRPFIISVVAVDAEELDFGRNVVDLSLLVQESMEKNAEGERVRQWNAVFKLSGKAKGGELELKLGYQIMEKDGGIFRSERSSDPFARKQSKTTFSVPSSNAASPRITAIVQSPKSARMKAMADDLRTIEHLNLDDDDPPVAPAPAPVPVPAVPRELDVDDLPDFEVVDKGVEIQKPEEEAESTTEENEETVSNEVVKEIVNDRLHQRRLTELDAIAEQIRALESIIGEDKPLTKEDRFTYQNLDAEEETVTREFLQMLEDDDEEAKSFGFQFLNDPSLKMKRREDDDENEKEVFIFLPDLGKGLGPVVQTRDGGFLAVANPLNVEVSRKSSPELAIQVSKPIVLRANTAGLSGFEIVQKLAALGVEELISRPFSFMPIDDLAGKTPEQIAFEGIASAVISGRNKEVASSSAARSIAVVKKLTVAMNSGRRDRLGTGLWNVGDESVLIEDLFASALQKVESMALDALKIQADMLDEDPPFDVSAFTSKPDPAANSVLETAVPVDQWNRKQITTVVSLAALVQFRDPSRRLEAVGAPMIAVVQAARLEKEKYEDEDEDEDELKFKITSVHVAGLKAKQGGKRSVWDGERQRLTSAQWLVAHGLGKAAKKEKEKPAKGSKAPVDLMWSISARVVAGLWLKATRNPDIKFPKHAAPVT